MKPPDETWSLKEAEKYEEDGYRYFKCDVCGKYIHIEHLKRHTCEIIVVNEQ